MLKRDSETVELIMEAKNNIACDRDLLRTFSRYLKEKTTRLKSLNERKPRKLLQKIIAKLQSTELFIQQLIRTANDLLKSIDDPKIRSIFDFFINGVKVLQSYNISYFKFKGIYSDCNNMVAHATELRKLIAA
ncbi:MAG TPA: hypothetical protein DEA43_00170 [Candidatus Moranbacteria bacterium]|nr:hypothetical protein [Candidatus Moranbacteria bacterium]HBT45286.1 hypothetical protein [Candidatus Moranbacteria bacterium]